MSNLDTFMTIYERELEKAMREHPEEYMPGRTAAEVAAKMRPAIVRGSYNKDGRAFRATCKALGIKHTYRSIQWYIDGSDETVKRLYGEQ